MFSALFRFPKLFQHAINYYLIYIPASSYSKGNLPNSFAIFNSFIVNLFTNIDVDTSWRLFRLLWSHETEQTSRCGMEMLWQSFEHARKPESKYFPLFELNCPQKYRNNKNVSYFIMPLANYLWIGWLVDPTSKQICLW